jgi:hypothetical protein
MEIKVLLAQLLMKTLWENRVEHSGGTSSFQSADSFCVYKIDEFGRLYAAIS